jgi:hypothetical protein
MIPICARCARQCLQISNLNLHKNDGQFYERSLGISLVKMPLSCEWLHTEVRRRMFRGAVPGKYFSVTFRTTEQPPQCLVILEIDPFGPSLLVSWEAVASMIEGKEKDS